MTTQSSFGFRPVQGVDEKLRALPYTEGYVYFATDTGKMYLDAEGQNKIPLGGSGAAVLYAASTAITERADGTYVIPYGDLEDESAVPKENDLIINVDGAFYKVIVADKDSNIIQSQRIAVSGTGGSGGGGGSGGDVSAFTLKLNSSTSFPVSFIYGQPHIVKFDVDAPTDAQVMVSFTVQSSMLGSEAKTYTVLCAGKGTCEFDIGSVLPAESGLAIKVVASGDNDGNSNTLYYRNRSAVEMELLKSSNFNALVPAQGQLTFKCIPVGVGLTKTLRIYLDNTLMNSLTRTITNSGQEVSIDIPAQSHGAHTIKAILSTASGTGEVETTPLEYEVAWVEAENTSPIIWINSYPETAVEHSKVAIEYMIYSPENNSKIPVNHYINGDKLPTSPIEISNSTSKWETWYISQYVIGMNTFTIECDGTSISRSVEVKITQDTERDMNILTSGLHLSLDPTGRSNKENISSRSNWSYTNGNGETTTVAFKDFNWYNNGWMTDDEGNSFLRISNGASISIPLDVLGSTSKLTNSLTFEMRFKVRNVNKFANLITTTTVGEDDTLQIIKKVSSNEGVFCSYFNSDIGFCLGTQEAFFKSKSATVNSRYMEDEMVSLSFVVEAISETKKNPLIYIYINGVCSGIVSYDDTDSFDARATEVKINSDYCDVDLYKFRVYKGHLASHEVVHNYIADLGDTEMYDMNQLCTYKDNVPYIDFIKVQEYNKNHPENPTMPYAVLEVAQQEGQTEDLLPFVKGGKKIVNVDFVNPSLDIAWDNGEVSKEDYVCGSPSFHAEGASFDVQGTSSQGYPRRNYKGKFKSCSVWNYTNGPLKDLSLLETQTLENGNSYKNLYLDNKSAAESTFTWKADYMESSGSYNTGFASYVKILYDHHPLLDYMKDYETGDHRTTVYGFPMMVFHKHWDGTYEFVGRYNFNLDKSCNKVIDFENKTQHPFVDGTYQDGEEIKPLDFAHVAECWEFSHNQGGRVAFKRTDFDEVDENGNLTILNDFEYRYSYYEDEIDAAIDGDATVTIPGTDKNFGDRTSANTYLQEKLKNLEDVVAWVCSTDTAGATNGNLLASVVYGNTTYTIDSAEYRLAKFQNEFAQHFNKEYCYVYFIMTELLIQYDSRGKNLMLATWGPQRKGGNYIWYPIYYDIDTQLGVNNSGVPSWDYDVEPTRDGIFSTAGSVLWNNLWSCFGEDIKKWYADMRKNNLTIEKLNGYFDFDPDVSHSYAMRGCRPLVVMNVDEYFKYIAPSVSGYINTSGQTAYDTKGQFFYCLQGNRALSRQQLLRNRFNYLDSEWRGGSYSIEQVKQGNIQMRWNANDYLKTSDKFLKQAPEDIESEAYKTFIANGGIIMEPNQNYPLDASIDFTLAPYLKQYCSVYFDEIAVPAASGSSTFYDEVYPVTIEPTAALQKDIDSSASPLSQQLVYIGGAQFLSSLGDLSTKYLDELNISGCVRLKELVVGSEVDGYKNELMKDSMFNLDDSATSANAKPLLETIVLSKLGTLTSTQDVSGSEKLKTFRALGTNIGGVKLAEGTQIETLYLPNSISQLSLVEPLYLDKILKIKPVGETALAYRPIRLSADTFEVGKYYVKDKDSYTLSNDAFSASKVYYESYETLEFPKGLYIEGLTNLKVADDSLTKINELNLVGGNMGYSSYELARKLVDIKLKMIENPELDTSTYNKVLRINLENMTWSPYRLVEYGEVYSTSATYVKKTDNYTYEGYTPGANWDTDTLNGRIYELDTSISEETLNNITDLSLLDDFIDSYNSDDKWIRSTDETSIPYVSGLMFINNTDDDPINEEDIKNVYGVYFPDLTIYAKNVNKSYTAKFVEILDSGVEKEWGVLKFPTTELHPRLPEPGDKINPAKLHYDFCGWSLRDGGEVLSEQDVEKLVFSEETPLYTFYAVYTITFYNHEFWNGSSMTTYSIEYGHKLSEPATMPVYTGDSSSLSFYERYGFVGWTDQADAAGLIAPEKAASVVVDVSSFVSNKVYKFYACYCLQDVHEVETDASYFTFIATTGGYLIGCNNQKTLSGKITLPTLTPEKAYTQNGHLYLSWGDDAPESEKVPAGQPIVGIAQGTDTDGIGLARNFSDKEEITHVFWKGGAEAAGAITKILPYTFWGCDKLEYFEYPIGIKEVGNYAFANDKRYSFGDGNLLSRTILPDTLVSIGTSAYQGAFKTEAESGFILEDDKKTLYFPGSLVSIGDSAFKQMLQITSLQFGDSDNPSQLNLDSCGDEIFYQDLYNSSTGSGATKPNQEIQKISIYSSSQFAENDEVIEKFGLTDNHNITVEWPNANK